MRPFLWSATGVIAGALVTSTVFVAQHRLAADETRAAVTAVKNAIVTGHRARDAAALSALYADDYTRAFSEKKWNHPPFCAADVRRATKSTKRLKIK